MVPLDLTASRPVAARAGLKGRVSIEATPAQIAKGAAALEALPPQTEIFLPYLPGADIGDSVAAAHTVAAQGFRPIPHLPARAIPDAAALDALLARYSAIGVEGVLLIAGDLERPQGVFADTLALLETGLLAAHGLRIAIAGHPEGHPKADQPALERALLAKAAYAHAHGVEMRIVTQFVFDAQPLIAWERRLRAIGVTLPVRVGLAGPAKMRTVLSYALQCGVGASARMLMKRPSAARTLGRWSPDAVLADLAAHCAATPDSLIDGLHLFPFGGLAAARDWLAEE